MHILYWEVKDTSQNAKGQDDTISKSKICTLDCTLEEHLVLDQRQHKKRLPVIFGNRKEQ